MTVDTLKVIITANNEEFNRKMASTNQKLAGFKKESVSSGVAAQKTSSSLAAMGKAAAVAAAGIAAMRSALQFGKEAISVASDITEVQNVVDVAFGDMSGMVEDFAQTCIDKFGMSELAAKKTASTYMAMNKGMGLYSQEAAQMAIDAAARTGDIASFYNMEQSEADTLMKSIWTGETESLKRIGVVMTQTNLDAYALANGFGKTTQKMSQQERVWLQYKYVMEQTRLAAGDFEKTQDSWANQTRILSERWKQFQGVMGQGLISALTPGLKLLNSLLEKLMVFAESFNAVMQGLFGSSSGAQSMQDVADATNQATNAQDGLANSTTKAAKAAKKALAPFDELNVIQTKNDSSGASGNTGNVGGSIPPIKTPEFDTSSIDALTEKVKDYMREIRNEIPEEAFRSFDKAIDRFGKSWGDLMHGFKESDGVIPKVLGYFGTAATLKVTHLTDAGAGLVKMFDGLIHLDFAKFFDGWKNVNLTMVAAPAERLANAIDHIFGTDTLSKLLKGKELLMDLNLSDDAIPKVNLFADGVSRITQQKVEPFLKQVDSLDTTIKSLTWKEDLIQQKDVDAVKGQVEKIRKTIVNELDADKNEALKNLEPLKNVMSASDYDSLLNSSKSYYDKQKQSVEKYEAQINQIMKKASSEKRGLTSEEQQEINSIQEKMKNNGIRHLSESETESNLILRRLKDNATALSTQQASEIVKNSVKTRDETIKNAEKQYSQIRTEADRMFETGAISKEQYDKIIEAAEKSRADTVGKAQSQHDEIVREAKNQAGDLAKNVDWSNGEIKTKYQVMKDDVVRVFSKMWGDIKSFFSKEKWKEIGKQATDGLKQIFDKFQIKIKTPKFKWVEDGLQATGAFRKTLEFLDLPTALPRLDVSWYAKGGVFNKPSIIGVGEAGKEAVVPLERNTGWIDSMARKISERISSTSQTAPARPEQPLKITVQLRDTEMASWMINNINALQNKAGGALLTT